MLNGCKVVLVGLALSLGAPAAASGLGQTSSASVSIRVTIPPFLAALAAQNEGAVGIWTVTDDKNALMIKIPESLAPGQSSEAAIFSGSSILFSVAPEAGSALEISAHRTTTDNGLSRQAYSVTTSPGFQPTHDDVSMIVVSAI